MNKNFFLILGSVGIIMCIFFILTRTEKFKKSQFNSLPNKNLRNIENQQYKTMEGAFGMDSSFITTRR